MVQDLRRIVQPDTHTGDSVAQAKRVFNSVLQTEAQLGRAMDDVYQSAVEENVKCTQV